MNTISEYTVSWVEIRPSKGICTQVDQKAMNLNCIARKYNKGSKCIYIHFANKAKAQAFINGIDSTKLTKHYFFTIFTDRQFGAAMPMPKGELLVNFTNKQINERVVL